MITDNGIVILLFWPILMGLICAGVIFVINGFSRIADNWR